MVRHSEQLQREIRQHRPFRTRGHEAVVALLRTADRVRVVISAVIEAYGVTLQQYNVLRILRGAGEEGLATLELGGRMIEHACGITRLLDRLEVKGLVRRERHLRDRRQVLCFIEPAGLELLARMDRPVDAADEATIASLEPEEQDELFRLLARIRAECEQEG